METQMGEKQRPSQAVVYRSAAQEYDGLVSAEDAGGALRRFLRQVGRGRHPVLDVGTGTGRMVRLLGERTGVTTGIDASLHMLLEARARDPGSRGLAAADAADLPFPSSIFGLVMAGWVLGHSTVWHGSRWEATAERHLKEMLRVASRGALLLLVETLGTCVDEPGPPTPELAHYYRWLEQEKGFSRLATVATDYQFESIGEATRLFRAFFGPDLAVKVRQRRKTRVPEFTGVWLRRK